MYFLYMMLCYLCTRPSASYVLLAANIDDFRTLAKRFAPENLADQILAFATDPKEKAIHPTSEETALSSETSEEKAQTKHKQKYVQRGSKVRNPTSSTPSAYEFQLDDLVARVKERLQKELKVMATSKDSLKYTPEHYNEAATTETATGNAVDRPKPNQRQPAFDITKPHTVKFKQPRDQLKHNEKDRNVGHERYVEPNVQDHYNPEAIPPPSKYLEHEKRIAPEPVPSRPQRITNIRNKQRKIVRPQLTSEVTTEAETENILNLFQGIDMEQKKDSYEDYVTPKKEENYEEAIPPSKTENTNKNFELFTDEILTTQKADDLSEVEETTNYNQEQSAEYVTEEVRTTKFNKLKHVIRLTEDKTKQHRNIKRQSSVKRLKQIQPLPVKTTRDPDQPLPYAEQIAVTPEYDDEPRIVTDEVKARTESIREEEAVIQPEIMPYKMANPNLLKRNRNKKVQKAGTVIPKRDFYKMSSPNYVAKLPKVAEPYKFDEPIPEGDREPEVFEPFANPPASINGKVRLS